MGQAQEQDIRKYAQGDTIIRQGDPSPMPCVIKSGLVSVHKMVGAKQVKLAELGPGEMFGEMSLISGEPASATVQAEEKTAVYVLKPESLQKFLDKTPSPVKHVVRFLTSRLRDMSLLMADQPQSSFFYSVCCIVDMFYRAEVGLGPEGHEEGRPGLSGVSYRRLVKRVKEVTQANQLDVDRVVKKLERMGLVTMREQRAQSYHTTLGGVRVKDGDRLVDTYLEVAEPQRFLKTCKAISEELTDNCKLVVCTEYLDLDDFAQSLGVGSQALMRRIGQGRFPPELVLVPKTPAMEWMRGMGLAFFQDQDALAPGGDQDSTQGRFSVDDITRLDNKVLRMAFEKVAFRVLAVLFKAASEAVRKKIESNLSQHMLGTISDEARTMVITKEELAAAEAAMHAVLTSLRGETQDKEHMS